MATTALIAHIAAAKFAWQSTLYRQTQILAGQGVVVDCQTLARWMGSAAGLVKSLYDLQLKTMHGFEPLFLRSPDGEVDPQPWCMGFYAVMRLRLLVWWRLLSPNSTEHLMLRPILVHCVNDAGRPLLPPAPHMLGTMPIVQNSWRDIPAAVEALRQFWMPMRFRRGA
jgi:hypothetical protein